MRRAILLLLVLGAAPRAMAREGCVTEGIQIFPAPGSVIPTNTRLILEGIGSEQERVGKLVGQEMLLRSNDDTVTVKVLRGWRSSMNRVAVVLRPRVLLKSNRQYRLDLDALLPGFTVVGLGSSLPSWRTGKGADDHAPRWLDKPAVTEGQYRVVDGQLVRNVKFRMAMQEESPAYLVMSIRRVRGSPAVQTYFLPVQGGEVLAGHDGCSGAFVYEDGVAYRATIECYDAAGNLAARVPPVEFHAPRPVRP